MQQFLHILWDIRYLPCQKRETIFDTASRPFTPYPEPVYTGWSSVHWNVTGWPSVHWDTTGRPIEYLQGTREHHWKNLVETAPHWNATGETLTFVAYTTAPLEGL